MAASDNISDRQFYDSPQGTRYELRHDWHSVMAHRVVKSTGQPTKSPVGGLNYFSTNIGANNKPDLPTVFKAVVNEPHRRRGLASAMFDFANQHAQAQYGKPLQHSSALSEAGKAFVAGHTAKRYGDPT